MLYIKISLHTPLDNNKKYKSPLDPLALSLSQILTNSMQLKIRMRTEQESDFQTSLEGAISAHMLIGPFPLP